MGSGPLRERVLGRAQRCGSGRPDAGRAGLWRRCGPKVRRWAGERLGRAECVGSGPLGEGREEWAERAWAWAAVGFSSLFISKLFYS